MNFEGMIKEELWSAIRGSYNAGNYTHAIRDAMAFITDVLRDKSGLDGDGDNLVGQALGSGQDQQPKLMINRFQTQTEKDEQRGLMLVLKGLFALVRNPRSHEQMQDTQDVADRIILFIDYLTDFLGASEQSFTVQSFTGMVTDPHFVRDSEYVAGLIKRVPAMKMTDTLISVYRNLNWKQAGNFELVIREMIEKLNESQLDEFRSVVSDDLQNADSTTTVTLIIKILPSDTWPQLDKMARLRAEQMLLDELDTAWYVPKSEETNSPAATWITRIAKHYNRKEHLRRSILSALRDDDFDRHNFIGEYFMARGNLHEIFSTEAQAKSCIRVIASTLRRGNAFMKDRLVNYLSTDSPDDWDKLAIEELKDLADEENPQVYLPDGTPLLGRFEEKQNPATESQGPISEHEIPF